MVHEGCVYWCFQHRNLLAKVQIGYGIHEGSSLSVVGKGLPYTDTLPIVIESDSRVQ